jgi:hypothetical protein
MKTIEDRLIAELYCRLKGIAQLDSSQASSSQPSPSP